MIKFSDAATLAKTKLHTHKIRITLSIIIPILLFAIILAAATLFRGFQATLNDFNSEGLGGRFLVSATNSRYFAGDYMKAYTENEDLISLIRKLHKEGVEEHKKLAKELGIKYEDYFDPEPVEEQYGSHYLTSSPYVWQAKNQFFDGYDATEDDIYRISENYNPKNIFKINGFRPNNGSFFVIENGAEDYKQLDPREGPDDTASKFISSSIAVFDDELAEPFIMSKQTDFDDKVPLIITYDAAEKILGLKALPNYASSEEKIARMREVKSAIIDKEVATCFRNNLSIEKLKQALFPNEYASTSYAKPTKACEEATIEKDDRSEEQKSKEADLLKFKKALGEEETDAWTDEMTFVIIGLTPRDSRLEQYSNNLWQLFQGLTGSSIYGSVIPRSYFNQNPKFEKLFSPHDHLQAKLTSRSYVLEFNDRETATKFIDENSNHYEKTTPEKPFDIDLYANNSIILDELFETLTKIVLLALAVTILISVLFLSSTFIKIITSARKEIAVFRAIGFKKSDILRIYQVYSLIFALIISLSALVIGLLTALILSQIFAAPLQKELTALFSTLTSEKTATLFQPHPLEILALPALIITTALLCSTLPALLAIRRNPIKDLREE